MATPARKPRDAILRLLERDERVFAVLLAVVMVGGLATLGLDPLRARHRIDIYSLVLWYAAYKLGIFALVTVSPRATRGIFIGALGVDLLLVFALIYLTGGGYSLFYLLFFPLVAVNAYYFGRLVGLGVALVAGLLFYAAAALAPPRVSWTAVIILMGLVGLPAYALGHVAERERRARGEVERLNAELTGTLTRLRAAQEKLVNAELLGDIVRERPGSEMEEAVSLVRAIRDQVAALDALTEEYLAFARFPRPQFEEDSVNDMIAAVVDFVRPLAARQGIRVTVTTDPAVPPMEIDRTLLRQAVLNLIKNGLEALSKGGTLTVTTRRLDDTVEIAVSDTGPGIPPEVGRRLFEQFFTTKPQGTGLGLSISRQIVEEHEGQLRWTSTPGAGATFTIAIPLKRTLHA